MNKISNYVKKYRKYLFILIIAILIEVFICNYTSLRILTANEKNIESDFDVVEDMSYFSYRYPEPPTNPEYEIYYKTLILKNIENDIYSVQLKSKNATDNAYGNIIVIANEKPYTIDNININSEIASKTSKINDDGTPVNLFIDAENTNEVYINLVLYGEDVEIEKVILNKFNFGFNFIRLTLIFLIMLFIYFIKTKKIYKIYYNKYNKSHIRIFVTTSIIVILLIFLYCVFEHFFYPEKIVMDPENTADTLVLQADALLHGSISFLDKPDSSITDLKNPYDISARTYKDSEYLFDSAYYNGEFYQYFSILPVIFFTIPIKLITGSYIVTKVINSFLFCFLLVLLTRLYKCLIDRYIEKISMFNFILGYVTIIFGSNVINYSRGLMYDIPVVFGLTSLIWAILILFNLERSNKYCYLKLIFVGIFTGFIVMSKPSLIGYYILIFYLMYKYLNSFKSDKKQLIKKFLAFFIPLGLLGIIQMWFNYVRFDSIFNFGALYQLTIADMNVHIGVSLPILLKGILRFLFTLPKIEAFKFPFINTYDNLYYSTGLNEYEYENCVAGILIIPIIWGIFLKRKLPNTTTKDKNLIKLVNLAIITAILLLVIVTCFAGAAEAYSIDIKLMLVITSVLIFLKLIENKESNDLQKYNYIFLVLCMISIALVLPQSFTTEGSLLENMYMPINGILQEIFAFWL